MKFFLISFLISFLFTCILVLSKRYHHKFSNDTPGQAPQKFHLVNTPRIGGLSIILSLIFVNFYQTQLDNYKSPIIFFVLIFFTGLVEDIFKKNYVFFRLFFVILGSFLLCYSTDIRIARVGIELVDHYLKNHFFISIIFASIAIVSITNAFNIIDGYNGLSAFTSFLMLFSLFLISAMSHDNLLVFYSLIGMGSIFGFFLWNWPFGKIFLGDGGAYLIGFYLSINLILLVLRNEQVSPWYPITLLSYPIIELIFSVYRKSYLRKTNALKPDRLHLHMLLYSRVFRKKYKDNLLKSNSYTSIFLWVFVLFSIIPATIFYRNVFWLITLFFLNIFLYLFIYMKLVKFKFHFFRN